MSNTGKVIDLSRPRNLAEGETLRIGMIVDVQIPHVINGNGVQIITPGLLAFLSKNPDCQVHVKVIHNYEKSLNVVNKLIAFMVAQGWRVEDEK